MKRKLMILALILLNVSSFGQSPEKVKNNILGTWKFENMYNPYGSIEPRVEFSKDPRELYTAYTFMDNGRVTIWSLDREKWDMGNQTLTWGVFTKKDAKGEEFTAVKLVDPDIDPNDIQKIESSNTGIIYIIRTSTKNKLLWIKIDRLDRLWKTNWQKFYSKIPDVPTE